jgi:hypothetical protein
MCESELTAITSLKSINRMVFVMGTQRDFWQVGRTLKYYLDKLQAYHQQSNSNNPWHTLDQSLIMVDKLRPKCTNPKCRNSRWYKTYAEGWMENIPQ